MEHHPEWLAEGIEQHRHCDEKPTVHQYSGADGIAMVLTCFRRVLQEGIQGEGGSQAGNQEEYLLQQNPVAEFHLRQYPDDQQHVAQAVHHRQGLVCEPPDPFSQMPAQFHDRRPLP